MLAGDGQTANHERYINMVLKVVLWLCFSAVGEERHRVAQRCRTCVATGSCQGGASRLGEWRFLFLCAPRTVGESIADVVSFKVRVGLQDLLHGVPCSQ